MKASNLRLGNIFRDKYTGVFIPVLELSKDRITFDYQTKGKWQAEPISLTEEILFKIGFELDFKGCYGYKYKFFIFKNLNNVVLGLSDSDFYFNYANECIHLKHLHQLQNIYHALKGEEIEININDLNLEQ